MLVVADTVRSTLVSALVPLRHVGMIPHHDGQMSPQPDTFARVRISYLI